LFNKAYSLRVYGRVQRVGFRRYVLDLAQDLNLSGYVKNLSDGSVEIFVQGEEEKLSKFLESIKQPPPPAKIREIKEEETSEKTEIKEFRIVYGEIADELQEGFGAMQTTFYEYWKEFRDYREEFRDYRNEFRDYREEFRDYWKEFRDYREEFRDYRNEFRDYRNEFRDYREEFRDYWKEFRDYREEFRDYRNEFRDYREEFRDFAKRTDENFKLILNKYGEISEKMTIILETLIKESKETREMLNETMRLLKEALERLPRAKD
jgi:acylphosphatase